MRFTAGASSVIAFQKDLHTIFTQNSVLKLEIATLKGQLTELGIIKKENEFLKKQLDIRQIYSDSVVIGNVIGWQADSIGRKMLINIGTDNEIAARMPVVYGTFLIGIIDEVAKHSATVEVITSPQSFIPAMVSKNDGNTKILGIAEGAFGFNLRLTQISQDAEIAVGDIVVTSGQGGNLPTGLILGTIEDVTQNQNEVYKQAKIIPALAFEGLDQVTVIMSNQF